MVDQHYLLVSGDGGLNITRFKVSPAKAGNHGNHEKRNRASTPAKYLSRGVCDDNASTMASTTWYVLRENSPVKLAIAKNVIKLPVMNLPYFPGHFFFKETRSKHYGSPAIR